MNNPYRTLGVPRDADLPTIKSAYRRLAKTLHPDHNPGDAAAEQRFKEVTEAYQVLADPIKRAALDRSRLDAGSTRRGPAADERGASWWGDGIEGVFERMFGSGFGRQQRTADERAFEAAFKEHLDAADGRRRGLRGSDQHVKLEVDFLSAMRGGKQPIVTADGRRLEVELPPGADDGRTLRLRGQGGKSPLDGPPGDLLVHVTIATHSHFRRQGRDIHLDLPITLAEAVHGAKITVPTIDGPVRVTVEPGANSGQMLRLKNRGVADRRNQRGDQFVRLMIMLPTPLDPRLAELLVRWADHDPAQIRRSFETMPGDDS